jgi:hypothetical protein
MHSTSSGIFGISTSSKSGGEVGGEAAGGEAGLDIFILIYIQSMFILRLEYKH